MQEEDLYKLLFSTINKVPTTVRPRPPKDDIELDDQAPLALVISIAAPVFIGFVILVLIYCCCRRKPSANSNRPNNAAGNTTVYHRAPDGEGNGMGMAAVASYPMTTVSAPYPGGYHPGPLPPHPPQSQGYRMPAAMAPSPLPTYPNQQVPVPPGPHFGGVPATYPTSAPHPYPGAVYLPPNSHPHTHSFSHSSQASSVSGTTAEPCMPSSPPQQHYPLMPQQQQYYIQQQQQQRFYHHPQQMQQFQIPPGHESPAPHHHYPPPPPQPQPPPPQLLQQHLVQSADPTTGSARPPSPSAFSAVSSPSESNEPAKIKTEAAESSSPVGLRQPQVAAEQDLGYSDEEE